MDGPWATPRPCSECPTKRARSEACHSHVEAPTLPVIDGQIQAIRTVLNPDKLRHLGPVADAWAVLREAGLSRQPAG